MFDLQQLYLLEECKAWPILLERAPFLALDCDSYKNGTGSYDIKELRVIQMSPLKASLQVMYFYYAATTCYRLISEPLNTPMRIEHSQQKLTAQSPVHI